MSASTNLTLENQHEAASVTRLPRRRRFRVTIAGVAAAVGGLIITALLVMAIFAPLLTPYDPTERVGRPFAQPDAEHPLGTNDIGQDILSELLYGTRVSLLVGVTAALVALVIGTTVGVLGGYFKRAGAVLMRATDVVLVLPFLPLLILLAAYLGRSLLNTVIVIGVLIWAGTARVIRSQVLTIINQDYVLAARAVGAKDWHIIRKHILPQVMLLALGEFVQATSGAILLEAARVLKPKGYCVLMTQEVTLMEILLADNLAWKVVEEIRVDLRGLHPRIFVIQRTGQVAG